jgi:WD40-like Beta Propeller Repeat
MKLFAQTFGAGYAATTATSATTSRTFRAPIALKLKVSRTLSVLAAVVAALFAASGCNDYGNTFQSPTGAPISFIAPSQANAGGAAFTITVSSPSGGFVTQTVVQWDGKTIPTTVVSATTVTATISADLIAKAGTNFVNTLNPFHGTGMNGLSNTLTFLVNPAANPVPAVTSMSPKAATVGSPSFTLTVSGSNFIPTSDPSGGSQVRFNLGPTQTSLPILSITASQITATVGANLLINATAAPVTAIVTVYNPPAAGTPAANGGVANPTSGGGGTSPGGLSFTVNPVGTPSNAAPRAEAAEATEDTPAVSADGRYVAYAATQGDHSQVFVRDTCEGADSGCQSHTTLLSAASDGTVGNADSRSPSMSSDGRYIAFSSAATNLATAATASSSASASTAGRQIYLRDTCIGAQSQCSSSTQLISTDPTGALVGTEGILPSVSASGRFIAFLAVTPSHATSQSNSNAAAKSGSAAASAASTPNSGFRQVFVRDTCIGASSCTPKTTRISLQPGDTSSSSSPSSEAKPAGPAVSANSTRVAIPGAATATVFTHSVAVDDRVFLALTGNRP